MRFDSLIRTKLRVPLTRPGLVARPRLEERVLEGLRDPLILVAAPAGFGKTTLVASAVAVCGMPVAWISLDSGDNQAGRFLNYLVAALQSADQAVGSEAAQLLAAPQQVLPESVLTSMINDLDTTGREIVLVLDDYQSINNPVVHTAVAFLLEHRTPTLHLVIATRSDPPLPLARLRARGQAVELRAADLRFSAVEAAQFLNQVMSLRLDPAAVGLLEERTEGWIAGLQMAALSMRDREDVGGFIAGFSGTHRYILDYLLEEVLAGQPREVQRFLLYTAILERLTAPLCEAILAEGSEPAVGDGSGQAEPPMLGPAAAAVELDYLERANLFLIPLDDERAWYRYHSLFADLLRARLDQTYPGLAPRLHRRAAAWLEEQGLMVEAVNQALAAGAHDQAARLVEQNTTRLLEQGELDALMGWVEALPLALREQRPWLCVHQAYALVFAGRLGEVQPLLAQAEAALDSGLAADAQALAGAIAAIRAMAAVMNGQDAAAISLAQRAAELLPAERGWDRAAAAWALGFAQRSLGRLPAARAAFQEQIRLARAMGNIWTLVTGLTDLAQVVRSQGYLLQARALLEEALAEASRQGARSLGYIARMEAALGGVLYEQNELEAAQRLLGEALEHSRRWPNPNHLAYAYMIQARVLLARGDSQGAWASLAEAEQVRNRAPVTRMVGRLVEAALVRVLLARQKAGDLVLPGDPLAARAAALVEGWRRAASATTDSGAGSSADEGAETGALALARALLGAGQAEEARFRLACIVREAREAGLVEVLAGALALTALAAEPAADSNGPLEEALRLAEPRGYMRLFLDEGRPLQLLLARWLAHAGAAHPQRAYVLRLMAGFEAEPGATLAVQQKPSATGGLVEPLSIRELEVLQLIALGQTNQEIARQLIVAPGTVKAHTASIYRKLDVANRTEAAARARQLGLLT